MSNRYDITIEQGSTFLLDFTVRDKVSGVGLLLSTYNATLTVKPDYGQDAILTLTKTAGQITLNNVGQVSVNGSATLTAAMPTGRHVWDIELRSADGTDVFKPLAGKCRVKPEVTA
jgi:hypothetical protein